MNDNFLVGIVALAVLPFIGLRIWRGARTGSLPLYRTYLRREDDRARFGALMVLHCLSFLLMAGIGLDLVFGLGRLWRG